MNTRRTPVALAAWFLAGCLRRQTHPAPGTRPLSPGTGHQRSTSVNVTPAGRAHGPAPEPMVARPVQGPTVTKLIDHHIEQAFLSKTIGSGAPNGIVVPVPWACRQFGHEPMATNHDRCYDGCDLSEGEP